MVADGYKDTEIGVIPENWEVKSLSMIGSFSKGKGISKNEVVEDGIPCMRYAEIYTEYDTVLKNIKSFIGEKSALNSKQIRQGDILFAGSGETLDDIGKSVAFVDDFEAYVGGDTVILSPTMNYNSLFMSFQLNSTFVRTQLRKLGQGSSVVHIYSSGLEKVVVPFPPLKEQEKIADILSTADDKIDAIATQIEKAETLKKGLLQKLLSEGIGHSEFRDSEIGKIPESWEVVELDDVSNTTRLAGYEYSEYWEEKEEGDILALKGYNIGKGKIVNRDTFYISNKLSEQLIRSKLFIGDVVFPVVGTIGNAIAITKNDKYHINQNIAKITPNIVLNSDYLVQFLMSAKCRKEINRFNATTSQPNVLVGSLRKFRLPFPSLEEQKQIADILSTADEKLEVLRAKKEKYETLKKGLMQKLLSGEIRAV